MFREHQLTNKSTLRIFRSFQEHPTFILRPPVCQKRPECAALVLLPQAQIIPFELSSAQRQQAHIFQIF